MTFNTFFFTCNCFQLKIYPMKKLLTSINLLMIFWLVSCNSTDRKKDVIVETKTDTLSLEKKIVPWKTITKNFNNWYDYTYNNIILSQDFIPLDVDSSSIKKIDFLNKLRTGNVFAIKLPNDKTENPIYILIRNQSNDKNIKLTIKQMADIEIAHYQMEGKEAPNFNFTNLKGKTFTKASTIGKIVVLKCWFIRCGACVKEFPELNKLVEENKDRNDVVFISLAIDSKKDLVAFLKKKDFSYEVIPEMQNFMEAELNVTAYPTHLLINKKGNIIKVVSNVDELIPFLNKELIAK